MKPMFNFSAEDELWPAATVWPRAKTALVERFARVRPWNGDALGSTPVIDPDPVPVLRWVMHDIAQIEAWAGDDIDWQRELIRFFDERAPRLIRPNHELNNQLAQLKDDGAVHAVSALPYPVLEAAMRQTGSWRHITKVVSAQSEIPDEFSGGIHIETVESGVPTPFSDGR